MELAFIVKPGTAVFQNYFIQQEEEEKYRNLATAFFSKMEGTVKRFGKMKKLCCELDEETEKRYSNQLLKAKRFGVFREFRANSAMQKAWEKDVASQIDWDRMGANAFWYLDLIQRKISYTMWDWKGNLYGMVEAEALKPLPDWAQEIKLSDYYKVIEEIEEENR